MRDGDGKRFNYSGTNLLSGMVKLGYDFDNGHHVSLTQISGKDAGRTPWAAKTGLFDKHTGDQLRKRTVWRETQDNNTILKHAFTNPEISWFK